MADRIPKIVPLLISSLEIDESDEKMLAAAITYAKNQGVNCRYLGKGKKEGHLVVVDIDSDAGKSAYESLRPGQVKLVFSNEKISAKNTVSLTKPLKTGALTPLFLRLANKLDNLLGRRPPINQAPTQTTKKEEAPVEIVETLFHILHDAKKNRHTIKASVNGFPSLMVNGARNLLATEMGAEALKAVLATPSREVAVEHIEAADIPATSSNGINVSSLDSALWMAGIMWRPNIPIGGCDLDTPVRLKAWPNFTRNNFFSEHLKLSAALAVRPISLMKLHNMTDIALEEIICFYNAAYTIGLIDTNNETPRQSENSVAPSPPIKKDTKRRGLLTRLADRLGFG